MDPSHAQGCVDVSEPLGTYCRWHNNFLICYIIIYINVNFIYIGLHHHLDQISIIHPSMHFGSTFFISNIRMYILRRYAFSRYVSEQQPKIRACKACKSDLRSSLTGLNSIYKYVLIINWLCPLYWKVTKVSATYVCALTLHTGL